MKRSYFKLNIDDVMEIVSEHMAISEGFESFSTNTKVIKDGEEWYLLIAIGELEDMEIDHIDMDKLSKRVKYNGTHGDNNYWKTDDEIKKAINKFKDIE